MSTSGNVLNGLTEQKLLNLHTAFFAKVISVNGNTAKIQPLNMIKAVGGTAKKQAVLSVPIMQNVRKFSTQKITVSGTQITIPKIEQIEKGDTVYCLCGERDITETRKGKFALPPIGHHRMSDAVIIGVV